MCFLWQSNELLILLLLSVSTTPLEFWSADFSLNTAGLLPLFYHFMFWSSSFFSSGYPLACVAPTHAAFFSSPYSLSFPLSFFFSLRHIIPLTMVLSASPFSCSGFFLNLHSHLSISLLPSLFCFPSQIVSLPPFYFYPFSSPTLSVTASNMVYSLSRFPECEECCCFRMSPA